MIKLQFKYAPHKFQFSLFFWEMGDKILTYSFALIQFINK